MNAETFIHTQIQKGVVPGLSVLTGRDDSIFFHRCYGSKSLFPGKEPLQEDTIYDLASLTKPLVTSLLTLYLAQRKELSLDTPVAQLFPQLARFSGVTVTHLLTHTSGLPAWYPLYLSGPDYLSRFQDIPLRTRPGKWVTYSCMGYILLYYILEKVSGTSFRQLAHDVIFGPLGLERTFLKLPEALKSAAAPTEKGNAHERALARKWAETQKDEKYMELQRRFPWREGIIRGETHDLNSHYLGGTAGNAGLFSTARDLFRLCLEFYPATATILKPETLDYCWANFTPFQLGHRTAGFKRNSSLITSGGRAFSRGAIGHNGFTGTSVWLDIDKHGKSRKPGRTTTAIVLSNIVHPEIEPVNFDRIRRKLHKLLLAEF